MKKHKKKLTREQREHKEMLKKEHEHERKLEEELLKHDEEIRHRDEEIAHEEAERLHREEEDRLHEMAEREDAYRKMHEGTEHDLAVPYHEDTDDYDRGYYRSPLDYDRFDVDEFSDDEHHHTFDER